MNKLLLLFVLFTGACATEVGDVSQETFGAAGSVAVNVEPLILQTYNYVNSNNGGSMFTNTTLNALRHIAVPFGGTGTNYWNCTAPGNLPSDTATCVHPTSSSTNDVLFFYDCFVAGGWGQPYDVVKVCNVGFNFATIGIAQFDWRPGYTGRWYGWFDYSSNNNLFLFRENTRYMKRCTAAPDCNVNVAW